MSGYLDGVAGDACRYSAASCHRGKRCNEGLKEVGLLAVRFHSSQALRSAVSLKRLAMILVSRE